MTFLGAILSLLLPRSAWRVIQRRDRAGWREEHFIQNSEVRWWSRRLGSSPGSLWRFACF